MWSRKPQLLRNLIHPPSLSPDELAGLSTSLPSRIIKGHGDGETDGPYELQLGPFSEASFSNLGPANWTLLVQNCNSRIPALSDLLDCFSFLPNWRLDDVMVSYAVPGGSVGAHVDNYDVFLVQAAGRRLWKTSYSSISHDDESLVPNLDVRILRGGFTADEEWVLEPGDALYIPPRFPHHGISLDDQCMTYSIGFRAPTIASLLAGWTECLIEGGDLYGSFYVDRINDLVVNLDEPGRISDGAINEAYEVVMRQLQDSEEMRQQFRHWFAKEVSNNKLHSNDEEEMLNNGDITDTLDHIFQVSEPFEDQAMIVRQREGSVYTYVTDERGVCMYIDGQEWPVENIDVARTICGKRSQQPSLYAQLALRCPSLYDIVRRLFEADLLYVEEADCIQDEEEDLQ